MTAGLAAAVADVEGGAAWPLIKGLMTCMRARDTCCSTAGASRDADAALPLLPLAEAGALVLLPGWCCGAWLPGGVVAGAADAAAGAATEAAVGSADAGLAEAWVAAATAEWIAVPSMELAAWMRGAKLTGAPLPTCKVTGTSAGACRLKTVNKCKTWKFAPLYTCPSHLCVVGPRRTFAKGPCTLYMATEHVNLMIQHASTLLAYNDACTIAVTNQLWTAHK